ncbi:hypothetical protein F53441_8610 [Fusarium austroafricanum]|uniref:Uncharacterized protein n=1 Tax=Fusarium austroafricanum TaxID=2364996 RepID=A0A8H4KE53_9HYPO|nr:hypothetical protein F53441_8610 [Fusarium austroafricanum]
MIAAFGQGTDKIVRVSTTSHHLNITSPAFYLQQPTTRTAMASRSGKRPHCDSIDSDTPVPSKKYKQATSFTSDTSTTSTTPATSSIDLDYPSIQTPLCIDTLMPAFKSVQYDRPAYRSISPQPPSPRSH